MVSIENSGSMEKQKSAINNTSNSASDKSTDSASVNVSVQSDKSLANETWPYSLLAPGPVNLHPDVLKTLAEPMIHHRTPKFDAILKSVLHRVKMVFATQQPVFLLTSTGSGGMEALLVNTIDAGDKVLAIVGGKFGERWSEMAKNMGANVHEILVPWGQAVEPQSVTEFLKLHPDTKAVLCQACETSTAVYNPIQALGNITASYPECLFLVDGITALGALPLPMDEWHIDGLVGGSQKAFMLPTGMALLSLSPKAWKKCEQVKTLRYYFDLRRELKANQKGETFFSSNVLLIKALDTVLGLFAKTGLEPLYTQIQRRAEFTRWLGPRLGFSLYSQAPSNSLTAWNVPAGIDGAKMREHLEANYNITVMGGQDQLKGKILRIGHMGYITDAEQLRLARAVALTLQDLAPERDHKLDPDQIVKEAQQWLQTHP